MEYLKDFIVGFLGAAVVLSGPIIFMAIDIIRMDRAAKRRAQERDNARTMADR